jgi:hypothetical protein
MPEKEMALASEVRSSAEFAKTYPGALVCVRTDHKRSPGGTAELSPGRSPGKGFRDTTSPEGTAENGLQRSPGQASAVPPGLNHVFMLYPGLRPGLSSAVPTD